MVTTSAAGLLHQARVGRLCVGGLADVVMLNSVGSCPQGVGNRFSRDFAAENRRSGLPVAANRCFDGDRGSQRVEKFENDSRPAVEILDALLASTRRDVRLVVVDGRPLVADPDLGPVFEARRVVPRPIRVDDTLKIADSGLTRRIAGCPIVEPGVSAA